MKACPSCGQPVDDAAEECSGCGVIFSKWAARQSQQPPEAPAEPVTAAAEPIETVDATPTASRLKKWALPIALACAAAAFLGHRVFRSVFDWDPSQSAGESTGTLFPIVMNGKHGFIDSRGNVQISAQYDDARAPSEGLAAAAKDGKYGFLDANGTVAVLFEFAKVADFHEGLAFYSTGSKWGVLDSSGTRLSDPLFEPAGDDAPFFSGALANVRVDGKVVYVDRQGRTVLGPYEYGLPFHEGLASVSSGGPEQYGCINTAGQMAIPAADRSREIVFSEGVAAVESGDDWGYINHEGVPVIMASFKSAGDFHEGLAPVQKAGKWGAIDHQGRLLFTLGADVTQLHSFSEGLAVYETDTKKGYVDKTGRVVVKAAYDEAADFSHGLALVGRRAPPSVAYIDGNGRTVWHTNAAPETLFGTKP